MKYLLASSMTVVLFFSAITIQGKTQKPKIYKVKSHMMDGTTRKGYLYQVNNQMLYIVPVVGSTSPDSIQAGNIKSISIRRDGKVRRSAGIGVATGGLTLGILGAVTYEPCESCWFGPTSAGEAAFASGLLGAILGGAGGAIVGIFNNSSKRIDGNLLTYAAYVPTMKKYAAIK